MYVVVNHDDSFLPHYFTQSVILICAVDPDSTTYHKLLPQNTIDCWAPLLSKLHSDERFLPELLNKLSDTLTEEGNESDTVVLS